MHTGAFLSFALFDIFFHHLLLLLSTPLRNMSDIYGLACLTGSILKWYMIWGLHPTPFQGNIRNELALSHFYLGDPLCVFRRIIII